MGGVTVIKERDLPAERGRIAFKLKRLVRWAEKRIGELSDESVKLDKEEIKVFQEVMGGIKEVIRKADLAFSEIDARS